MAEKSEELLTRDEKINHAKEYFGRGSRNYAVKEYSEAVEDFSRCCELYADVYGAEADEIALPHLYYAKALVALAQSGENKVLALQDEEEEDDDPESAVGNEDDEGNEDDDDNAGKADEQNGKKEEGEKTDETEKVKTEEAGATNGQSNGNDGTTSEPQPGTSSGKTNGVNNGNGSAVETDIPEDEEEATNLQYAWEALEIAVKIFERQGEKSLPYLADAYFELAEISFENNHCLDAIKDYERSSKIRLKLPDENLRLIAETKYKVGLCYLLDGKYDESMEALTESSEYLNGVIESEKENEQNEKTEATIKEIEETKQEILNKIAEVREAKEQSLEEVKREIARIMNPIPESSNNDAGSSSAAAGGASASASLEVQEKPKDISHLIKRKKPDTPTDVPDGSSPAKKPTV